MKRSRLTFWAFLVTAGLWSGAESLRAADQVPDKSGVIHDPNWTILIRPANRGSQSPAFDSTSAVTPVAHEDEAPAPESVAAPAPGEMKAIGPELPPQFAPNAAAVLPGGPARMSYAEAYAAVPFSRAEYEGNPVYRHQAALELMFGVQRPTTLVQNYTPRAFRYPDSFQIPYGRSDTQHINIRQIGRPYGNAGYGYPFGGTTSW